MVGHGEPPGSFSLPGSASPPPHYPSRWDGQNWLGVRGEETGRVTGIPLYEGGTRTGGTRRSTRRGAIPESKPCATRSSGSSWKPNARPSVCWPPPSPSGLVPTLPSTRPPGDPVALRAATCRPTWALLRRAGRRLGRMPLKLSPPPAWPDRRRCAVLSPDRPSSAAPSARRYRTDPAPARAG